MLLALTQATFAQSYPELGRRFVEVPESFVGLLSKGTQSNIAAYSGDHTKELEKIYENRDDYLYAYYENDLLLTKPYWKDHIDALLDRIWEANPAYEDPDVEVYYALQASANAGSFGQGLIIVNLGLIQNVETEDEIAFVLCHEIAHQHLQHSNSRLHTGLNALYSKETQKKLRQLKRQKYNTLEELQSFALDFSFGSAQHSRYGEQEADSLGLILYQAAGFSSEAPLAVMEVLAKADTTYYGTKLDIEVLLNTSSFPFKERWTYKAPPSGFSRVAVLTEAERDSLRTHPDTEQRRAWLTESIKVQPSSKNLSDDITARKREASKEFVAAFFNYGLVGRSLYESMRMFDTPDSTWAKGIAALSLYRLAIARENRSFTRYARLPQDRTYDEGYEEVLRMLHGMRLSELKDLASAYAKTHASDFSDCGEELALARVLSSSLGDESPADRSRLQAAYRKIYPNSTYNSLLRSKEDPWVENIHE